MSNRFDVKVMGVVIGSATSEDQDDEGIQFYEFEPVYALPFQNIDTIHVDPWNGICKGYSTYGDGEADLNGWLHDVLKIR